MIILIVALRVARTIVLIVVCGTGDTVVRFGMRIMILRRSRLTAILCCFLRSSVSCILTIKDSHRATAECGSTPCEGCMCADGSACAAMQLMYTK